MILESQKSAFKQDMIAKSAPGQPLAELIANNDWQNVAAWYTASSGVNVWRPDAPRDAVFGAVDWNRMTVSDAPPSGAGSVTDGTAQNYANRCLQCQGFQINLQTMLPPGASTLPGDQAKYRRGLQDALSAVPSSVNGTTQDAGWAGVRNALQRPGTRFEVLFSVADQQANKSTAYGQQVEGIECFQVFTG